MTDKFKAYYVSQAGECLKIMPTDLRQVVLIRHAQPAVERPDRVTYEEAEKYLNDYRQSGIVPFYEHPVCTDVLPAMTIYHSNLERARQTAERIFSHNKFKLVSDMRYREFDRDNLKIPFRIRHKTHTKLSRIAWIVGAKKGEESRSEAFRRVRENASHFHALSKSEPLIILVAHGFHNYFLARSLRKLGWINVYDGGNGHLGVKILAR